MKNYYDELGVNPSADIETIKKAYLNLMKKYHPDLYTGDKKIAEEHTQKLNNIYNVLKDQQSRKNYDLSIGINSDQLPIVQNQQNSRRKADYDGGIFSGLKKRFTSGCSYDYTEEQDEYKKNYKNNKKTIKKPKKTINNIDEYNNENKKLSIAVFVLLALIAVLFIILLLI